MLREAVRELSSFPCTTRVLIVVSDGVPSGPGAHAADELHRAIRWVERHTDVHLVGIGLGPDTDHVLEYYRDGVAGVALEALPGTLAARIDALLRPGDR